MDINAIKKIAISEILEPKLELTKQLLSNHECVFKNGAPIIEDIIFNSVEEDISIYFPLHNENYFLVVYIHSNGELFVNTSPGNRVYFSAKSDKYDLAELTNLLDFEPTEKWNIGDKRKYADVPYDFSAFFYQHNPKDTGEIEDKIIELVDFLLIHKSKLKHLSNIAELCINVVYKGYKEQMWGLHFDREMLRKLSQLDIDIDIDIYASGPDIIM